MADDAAELSRIFHGTIVSRRYKGVNHPLIVKEVLPSYKRCINPFKDLWFKVIDKDCNIKKYLGSSLNLNPDFIGARNYRSGVVYSYIKPVRQYRWGWNTGSFNVRHNTIGTVLPISYDLDCIDWIRNYDFISDLINPAYPTAIEAEELIKSGERKSVAFGKRWFISKAGSILLYYRCTWVGTVRNGVANLFLNKQHLREELSDFMVVNDEELRRA